MKICSECQHMMYRETETGIVVFKCGGCEKEELGAPCDHLIFSEFTTGATNFSRTINEPDRTGVKVKKDCECGMDVVNQIFIESEHITSVFYRCDGCGRKFTD